MDQTPHIAILPSPEMGHLIPLVEFAKLLILQHNFSVTIILPTDRPLSIAQNTFLDSLPKGINQILLPPVNFDNLSDDVKVETRIFLTVTRSLPSLRDAFKSLIASKKLTALVVDLFGTDAFDVAKEFNVSPYIFFPSTATSLSFAFYLPKLHEMVSCEYRDFPEPIQIPGSIPIFGRDLLDVVQDRKNDAYKLLLHHSRRYALAEGIIVNSFKDLEPGPIKVLHEMKEPSIYPVGPLIQRDLTKQIDEPDEECFKWLDDQPSDSVLYISFGSGGTLSHNQLIELALGLEMSEQRFLWVVRSPNDGTANATFCSVQSQSDPLAYMPKGFLKRIEGRGFLVPSWAPQVKILNHGSTGGFLTHCGWNSTLESVVQGVPLIAWPLYAEQKMNAIMLAEELKVALRLKFDDENNGLIGRVEIANVVKGLIEGEEGKRVRTRMKKLKDAAVKVLSEDGSSTKALALVAHKWRSKICA
ncbi:hypothetical protein ACH5RR_000090 [Cinchona calisaya]|uniref:Glycosyltransferase n=1 Tax=Cinchona calisaya TaxID=153742 RepID=A0ABD3AZS8_9GENT